MLKNLVCNSKKVWLQIEKKSCIQFVPKQPHHKDYISVTRGYPSSIIGKCHGKHETNYGMHGHITDHNQIIFILTSQASACIWERQ